VVSTSGPGGCYLTIHCRDLETLDKAHREILDLRALAAAPSPVPAQEPGPWLIEHTDGQLEKTRDRERAYLARHLGHAVTPLYAAPVGYPADEVPMPQNAEQAAGMALLGEAWLRAHAPERLRTPVGQAEDAARWRALAASAKEELLDPRRAASEVAPDLRTHWVLPTLICSGPVGGHMTFAKSVDVLRAQQAVQPQPGEQR
jgi:hypothetical protein